MKGHSLVSELDIFREVVRDRYPHGGKVSSGALNHSQAGYGGRNLADQKQLAFIL